MPKTKSPKKARFCRRCPGQILLKACAHSKAARFGKQVTVNYLDFSDTSQHQATPQVNVRSLFLFLIPSEVWIAVCGKLKH